MFCGYPVSPRSLVVRRCISRHCDHRPGLENRAPLARPASCRSCATPRSRNAVRSTPRPLQSKCAWGKTAPRRRKAAPRRPPRSGPRACCMSACWRNNWNATALSRPNRTYWARCNRCLSPASNSMPTLSSAPYPGSGTLLGDISRPSTNRPSAIPKLPKSTPAVV